MNYLKKLAGLAPDTEKAKKEVSEILPVSDLSASFACQSSECHTKYSSSCFKLSPEAEATPLWESAKAPSIHILVSTGKTDWAHDAFNDDQPEGSILPKIAQESEKIGGVKLNVTGDGFDMSDLNFGEYATFKRCDLLILPWFVVVKGVTADNVQAVFEVISNVLETGTDGEQGKILMEKMIDGVSVVKNKNGSHILLCSHKTRDKKCGLTAPIMKKEFESQLNDHGLYRDASDDREGGSKVTFVNHVGGHKFSANVLIYKTNGSFVWFAKCNPLNVKYLIEETILNDKVYAENIRACKKFEGIDW
ncbi:Apd1 protein [Martiniozyma asiatica (nom. inval.)]|nr:Apd1 protein [Martiniozyma asiatica]